MKEEFQEKAEDLSGQKKKTMNSNIHLQWDQICNILQKKH